MSDSAAASKRDLRQEITDAMIAAMEIRSADCPGSRTVLRKSPGLGEL